MSRLRQVFVAPGEENEPLPLDSSPWHIDRAVYIPREHWELILDFAAKIDPVSARKLDSYSWAADNNPDDAVDVSREEIESAIKFMQQVKLQLITVEPLVPEANEETPDSFVNEEYVRMLDAVSAVFQEALKRDESFRAWTE
jgi:hypothetical protein